MNVASYILFTALCFSLARPPIWAVAAVNRRLEASRFHYRMPRSIQRVLAGVRMSKVQTVAVCFCGAAKTTSLGIPLVAAMWTEADDLTRSFVQIPVLLYTIEQVKWPYRS
jgi:solute carrier family 10 (sodium/bile acid cotransporter), member 7